jgi:O-antigen/teichoic acid export membrane protein
MHIQSIRAPILLFLKSTLTLPTQIADFLSVRCRISVSPLYKRLAGSAFWSILSTVISRGAGLVVTVPLARILGRETFGKYAILYATMAAAGSFFAAGLNMTATKYLAEFRQKDPKRAGRFINLGLFFSLSVGIVGAGSLFMLGPWISRSWLADPKMEPLVSACSLGVLISVVVSAQNGTLAGLELFQSIAFRNSLSGVIRIGIMVAGTLLYGLPGAVAGMIFSEWIVWALNELAIRNGCHEYGITRAVRGCLRELSLFSRFSIPATLGGMIIAPAAWTCNLILANQPEGYSHVALYNAALQWRTLITFVPVSVNIVLFPMLSSVFGLGDDRSYKRLLQVNALFYLAITGVAACIIALLAPMIMRMYGRGFSAGSATLSLIAFSSVFFALNELLTQALASRGKVWLCLLFQTLFAASLVALTYVLTARGWGADGAAAASLITYVLIALGQAVLLHRRLLNDSPH